MRDGCPDGMVCYDLPGALAVARYIRELEDYGDSAYRLCAEHTPSTPDGGAVLP